MVASDALSESERTQKGPQAFESDGCIRRTLQHLEENSLAHLTIIAAGHPKGSTPAPRPGLSTAENSDHSKRETRPITAPVTISPLAGPHRHGTALVGRTALCEAANTHSTWMVSFSKPHFVRLHNKV